MDKRLLKQLESLSIEDKRILFSQFGEELEKDLASLSDKPKVYPFLEIADETIKMMNDPDYKNGLKSGYSRFDFITKGFCKEELTIIAGATGHGKTMFAQNILHNMAMRGIPSLFVSMEMSNKQSGARMIEMHRNLEDKEGYGATTLPVFFMDTVNLTLNDIDLAIDEGKDKQGIQIVLIDHLHYFARSIDHTREQLDIMTKQFKQMAVKHQIPIILISHTRKLASDDTEPQEVDLKDSSGIAQDADQNIMIYRNKRHVDPDERKKLKYTITKNRMKGTEGSGHLIINPNWKLYELPDILQTEDTKRTSTSSRKSQKLPYNG